MTPLRRKIAALAVIPPIARVDAAQNKFYRSHHYSLLGLGTRLRWFFLGLGHCRRGRWSIRNYGEVH